MTDLVAASSNVTIAHMALAASKAGAVSLKTLCNIGLLHGDHKEFETWQNSNRVCWPSARFANRWNSRPFTRPTRDTERFELVDRQFDLKDGRTVCERGYIDNESGDKAVLYFFV